MEYSPARRRRMKKRAQARRESQTTGGPVEVRKLAPEEKTAQTRWQATLERRERMFGTPLDTAGEAGKVAETTSEASAATGARQPPE